MSLFLDKIITTKKIRKQQLGQPAAGRLILLNLIGETANSDELWIIGELWRLGRGGNLIIGGGDKSITGLSSSLSPSTSIIQIQMKATGKRVLRVKWRTVEEISIEEIGQKLKMIEESEDSVINSHNSNETEQIILNECNDSSTDVHFVLSASKAERNPILREKAGKALKLANPSKTEIVIHELPRDILKRFLSDQPRNTTLKVSEDFRDQLTKMGQLLQGKLAGKTVLFFNHKDNQIEMIFNK